MYIYIYIERERDVWKRCRLDFHLRFLKVSAFCEACAPNHPRDVRELIVRCECICDVIDT